MHRPPLVLTLVLCLLVRVPAGAQDLLFGRFGEYLESLRVQAGIPGLAGAIIANNEIFWQQAFGHQDIEQAVPTRTDTPFHLDGLTQLFAASLVLGCAEEGRLSLDERIGRFAADSPDADATVGQILTHTSRAGGVDSLSFTYALKRLEALAPVVTACTETSFQEALAALLDRLAMVDSVPGPNVVLAPVAPHDSTPERYSRVLDRLATPYTVDARGIATRSEYATAALTPASGLVSTVRDFANFDLALRQGVLLLPETLAAAWQAPPGSDGKPLPHGLGWFVQSYNGEKVVWQFGIGENASSSMVITVPGRGITFVLLANSHGLVKPFRLEAGDLTLSPFARLFLGLFVR